MFITQPHSIGVDSSLESLVLGLASLGYTD